MKEVVVKDVLTHILDAVDDEVSRRGKQGTKSTSSDDRRRSSANDKRSAAANNNRNSNDQRRMTSTTATPPANNPKQQPRAPTTVATPAANAKQQPRSMRDVVAGVVTAPDKPLNGVQSKAKPATVEPPRGSKIKPGLSYKSVIEPTRQQPAVVTPVTSNGAKAPERKDRVAEKDTSKPKSAGVESQKAVLPSVTQEKTKLFAPIVEGTATDPVAQEVVSSQSPPSPTEDDRNTPPLSTLLGPGTSCSATSSVASSLEAPHSSRFRHQSIATEDVGVHLLNVCKQLSEEIDTFMTRRSLALDIRRKERSAVLGALQDTLVVRYSELFCLGKRYVHTH
jgi:hypothetical protein